MGMEAYKLLAAILFLIGCELAGGCSNSSDDSLGLSMLTKYNISLDGESILTSEIYQVGEFEKCVDMKERKYCLTTVNIYPRDKGSPFWYTIQEVMKTPTNFRRDRLFVGLCVHESWNTHDIETALYEKLKAGADTLGVKVNVTLNPQVCQSKQPLTFTTADLAVGIVCLVITLIVLSATLYEGYLLLQKDENKGINLVLCFSLITNWKRLGSPPKFKPLRVIQTIRIVSLYFIIFGHEILIMVLAALENPEWLERSYHDLSRMIFFNGHLIVSTYFVISGFLLGYMGTDSLAKHGLTFLSYVKIIILRYVRLTPAYALIIALSATWFNYLGSGPHWYTVYGSEVEYCRNYWWLNLLYVNNYIHGDTPCLQHGWYLAADYQNFMVAILLLALVNKYKKMDKLILGFTLFLCMLIPAVQTYTERLDPMLITYPDTLRNVTHDRTYLRSYLAFHHNMTPYFVGVIAGYIFYKTNTNGIKFSKFVVLLLWVFSVTLPWMLLLAGYIFFLPTYKYNAITASVYAGTYRAAFSFGISTILLGCASGYGWVINTMATWKPAQILGRLTYCAFLIHLCVIRIEVASEKHPIYLSDYYVTQRAFSDLVCSFGAGMLLCLFVEMPCSALLKKVINSAIEASAASRKKHLNRNNEVEIAAQTYKKDQNEDIPDNSPSDITAIHISKSG